jgi:hypothetical protein
MADTQNKTLLEQLVNDEGLKFTVSLNVAPEIYAKLFATIVGSVVISLLAISLVKKYIIK